MPFGSTKGKVGISQAKDNLWVINLVSNKVPLKNDKGTGKMALLNER